MKSVFREEKTIGKTYTHVFADISKRDTHLVKRIVSKEELQVLNELPASGDNLSDITATT